jgi:hypothetical protein
MTHGSAISLTAPKKRYKRYKRYIPLIERNLMCRKGCVYRIAKVTRYMKVRIGMVMYRKYRMYRPI